MPKPGRYGALCFHSKRLGAGHRPPLQCDADAGTAPALSCITSLLHRSLAGCELLDHGERFFDMVRGLILSSALERVAAILESGMTTNVVRSVKSWSMSMPRLSFMPGFPLS